MLHMPSPMLLNAGGPDASAAAYFAAMSVQPDATRKALIEAYIVGLKADGVWSKLDCLWLIASHTEQAARLNVARPATQTLSPRNFAAFTTDKGYTCDGTSSYIETGYVPGPLFTQNSAHASTWINAVASDSVGALEFSLGYLGAADGTVRTLEITPKNFSGDVAGRVNDTGPYNPLPVATKVGLSMVSRTASSELRVGRNASYATASASSVALPFRQVALMRNDIPYSSTGLDTYWMQGRIAMASAGAGLTASEMAALYNRTNTYLTAIGAA